MASPISHLTAHQAKIRNINDSLLIAGRAMVLTEKSGKKHFVREMGMILPPFI